MNTVLKRCFCRYIKCVAIIFILVLTAPGVLVSAAFGVAGEAAHLKMAQINSLHSQDRTSEISAQISLTMPPCKGSNLPFLTRDRAPVSALAGTQP